MDRIAHDFSALGQRIRRLPVPDRVMSTPETLASLIDKVDAAKRLYQPGMRR